LIDDPNVVLRIDAHLLSDHEPIRILADLTNEFAGPVELVQARASVSEGPRGADCDRGMAGPRVDENISLGVSGHARHFADRNAVGVLQQVRIGIKGDFGRRILCANRKSG
jgi:hypothetical protein